ncbi:Hypothetical predicted protein [Pelobates cultripes]|uniref:Uncharacterized protein n=1 Tax=Pelobates cultripes TaxID=61616 RepID=A0AAD1TD40_PELCU|nr:Hypothetical predicted protein [Pelobates cultripes]
MAAEDTERACNNLAPTTQSAHKLKPALYPKQPKGNSQQSAPTRHIPSGTRSGALTPAPRRAQNMRKSRGHCKPVPAPQGITLKAHKRTPASQTSRGAGLPHNEPHTTHGKPHFNQHGRRRKATQLQHNREPRTRVTPLPWRHLINGVPEND